MLWSLTIVEVLSKALTQSEKHIGIFTHQFCALPMAFLTLVLTLSFACFSRIHPLLILTLGAYLICITTNACLPATPKQYRVLPLPITHFDSFSNTKTIYAFCGNQKLN